MSRPSKEHSEFSLPLDPRALAYVLWEKKCLIGAIVGLALLAGIVFLLRCERVYSATTTIEVEEEQRNLGRGDEHKMEGSAGEALLKTIEQNFDNPTLKLRLARNAELAGDPAFLPGLPRLASDARLQTAIGGKITASIRAGTRLIDVTAEDADPAIAQKLSRLAVEEFVGSTAEKRVEVSQQGQGLLRQEADRVKAELEKSERTLQRYKEQNQAVSLEEKQNLVTERLKEMNLKVTAARADRLKIETDRAQLTQLRNEPPERLLLLPSIASAEEVVDLQRQIGERSAEIATLSRRYKPEHPKYVEAVGALAGLKVRCNEAILRAADLVGTALEAAVAIEAKLEEALHGQESLALELSQMAIPYNALAREVESNRTLYASLLTKLKESDVGQSLSAYAIRVVAPAALPERPVKPNKPLILLLSLCGGLALALSVVLGAATLDRSVRTVDQAERELGLRSLAAIPHQAHTDLADARRLLFEKPQSAVAEAFRALRTTFLIKSRESDLRSVLFASAIPGEGKSFCSMNYAAALAGQGFRTLLIDGDLRLPSIGQAFLKPRTAAGLSEVLRGESRFDDAVQATDSENLSILPAGRMVSNPTELLGKADVEQFMQDALARFDRVVLDSAPVLAVSETAFFAPHVDAVCLVVRAGKTPRMAIERAIDKLRESGAKISGFILNGLPLRGGYYYHYQAPGYGRDEVYGGSAAKSR
jgi:capsular exopolysaccharide synthesis family protein